MGNRKRLTAFLLTAVMILTMPQMQIAAAEVESPADVGLCIHHTQHTEDCGYTEGEKETPCVHAHTEDCYAPMKQCVHEHGESCYPVAEDSASENTAEREPHTCTHECSEESGCITEKLDCDMSIMRTAAIPLLPRERPAPMNVRPAQYRSKSMHCRT